MTTFSKLGRVSLTPSYDGISSLKSPNTGSGVRNFWQWGIQEPSQKASDKKKSNIQFFDFKADRVTNKGGTSFDRNASNLSNSQIINDDLSKAEIEKMEIKLKIHDLMKVLQPNLNNAAKLRAAKLA